MPFPLAPELDYLCFANPSWFARLALGFSPDPHQERVLTSQHARRALCCSRQWGKSTLAAVLAVHRLVYGPSGNTSVIVAPALRQSRELLRKMRAFVRALGFRPRGDGDNPHSLMLPNASRVVAVPARDATTRGFSSVSLLILDEAARIPDFVYYAFRPMLAVSGGDLLALSTPAGEKTGQPDLRRASMNRIQVNGLWSPSIANHNSLRSPALRETSVALIFTSRATRPGKTGGSARNDTQPI